MKKLLISCLVALLALLPHNVSAQDLTREQMQDSIIAYLCPSPYSRLWKSIKQSDKNLDNIELVKIDCAAEKVFGYCEQTRNFYAQYLQGLPDSEIVRAYDYVKLISRIGSVEFLTSYMQDVAQVLYPNMETIMSKVQSGDKIDIKSLIKSKPFVINDKEIEAYLDVIIPQTRISETQNTISSLIDVIPNKGNANANSLKSLESFMHSIMELSSDYMKKYILVYYTRQELKQMSDYLSTASGKKMAETQNANQEDLKKVVSEIFNKIETTNWTKELEKVTDAEVAIHAQKFLLHIPHAKPVPREKGTLTINGGQYTGEIFNNEANGEGAYTDAKGNTYTGDFLNNKMDGYGVMVTSKGKESKGYWKQGKYLGEKPKDEDYGYQRKTVNGISESGIYKHGVLCGKGVRSIGNAVSIKGLFDEGKMIEGMLEVESENDRYIGKGAFDISMSGSGIIQFTSDKEVIEEHGYFTSSELFGYGTRIKQFTDGYAEEFQGLFIDGKFVGKGHVITQGEFDDGETYVSHYDGYYFNGKNGVGNDTIVGSRGFRCTRTGTFCAGEFVKGTETIKNATGAHTFEGEFKNGEYYKGTLRYSNGFQLTGTWKNGRINGKCVIVDSDGTIIEGNFIGGRCSNGTVKDKNGKVLRTNVSYSTVD